MVVRYFNLKEKSPTVNGGIIKVDTSERLENRLIDFNGDFAFSPWEFRHIGREVDDEIYEITLKEEKAVSVPGRDALGGLIGMPIGTTIGPDRIIRLRLNLGGELKLDSSSERIYLSEISEEKAEEMKHDAFLWAYQRAYIYE